MAGVTHPNRKPDGPLSVAERNAVVLAFLDQYPDPSAVVHLKWSAFARAAVYRESEEDVRAACLLGVVNAARLFDPAVGVAFVTLAVHHMRAAVKTLLHRHTRDGRRLGGAGVGSLDDDTGGRSLAEVIPARVAPGEPSVDVVAVLAAVSRESGELLARLYGLGGREPETYLRLARSTGVSRQTVVTRRREALAECRKVLETTH